VPSRVAARDLHPGDLLVKRRASVVRVDRPLSRTTTVRVILAKLKSGREFEREYGADELLQVQRGGAQRGGDGPSRGLGF
jgi:hypothetical protein